MNETVYPQLLGHNVALFHFTWQHISFSTSHIKLFAFSLTCKYPEVSQSNFSVRKFKFSLILLGCKVKIIKTFNFCFFIIFLGCTLNCTIKTHTHEHTNLLCYILHSSFRNCFYLLNSFLNTCQKEKEWFIFCTKYHQFHSFMHVSKYCKMENCSHLF